MKKLLAGMFAVVMVGMMSVGCLAQTADEDGEPSTGGEQVGEVEQMLGSTNKCCSQPGGGGNCADALVLYDEDGTPSYFCRSDKFAACCRDGGTCSGGFC